MNIITVSVCKHCRYSNSYFKYPFPVPVDFPPLSYLLWRYLDFPFSLQLHRWKVIWKFKDKHHRKFLSPSTLFLIIPPTYLLSYIITLYVQPEVAISGNMHAVNLNQ